MREFTSDEHRARMGQGRCVRSKATLDDDARPQSSNHNGTTADSKFPLKHKERFISGAVYVQEGPISLAAQVDGNCDGVI